MGTLASVLIILVGALSYAIGFRAGSKAAEASFQKEFENWRNDEPRSN